MQAESLQPFFSKNPKDEESIEQVEIALKYNQKMSKDMNSAQSSLFSADTGLEIPQPKLIDSDEFSKAELLQFEKSSQTP